MPPSFCAYSRSACAQMLIPFVVWWWIKVLAFSEFCFVLFLNKESKGSSLRNKSLTPSHWNVITCSSWRAVLSCLHKGFCWRSCTLQPPKSLRCIFSSWTLTLQVWSEGLRVKWLQFINYWIQLHDGVYQNKRQSRNIYDTPKYIKLLNHIKIIIQLMSLAVSGSRY